MNENNVYLKKIEEFKSFTKVNDDEIAKNYLIKNGWNVENSVCNYFDEINSSSNNQSNNVNYGNHPNFQYSSSSVNNQGSGGLFGFIKNVMDLGSGFFGHNETMFTNIYSNNNNNNHPNTIQPNINRGNQIPQKIQSSFDFITSKESNYKNFLNKLKQRPGILIAFNEGSLQRLSELITNIREEEYLIDIISNSYYLHLINSNSLEFKELSKDFSIHNIPAIIYINKNQFNSLNHDNVLLIDENFTIDSFRETIFNQINDPRNTPSTPVSNSGNENNQITNQTNLNNNNIYHDYYPHSDSDLIHTQNQELRELERLAEEQHKKQMRDKKEKEEKEIEEKKKIEEYEVNKNMLKSQLPPEPDHNDPDSYLIAFRSPHNDLRKERRFKNNEKIQTLYDYVNCHADEFEVKEFILFRPFLGTLDNKNRTLKEENLSNAVLQIKEL